MELSSEYAVVKTHVQEERFRKREEEKEWGGEGKGERETKNIFTKICQLRTKRIKKNLCVGASSRGKEVYECV